MIFSSVIRVKFSFYFGHKTKIDAFTTHEIS